MTQPDIYDLLTEAAQEQDPDLVVIQVRDDATGYIEPYAGQVVSDPMPRDTAEQIRRATPNGGQMDVIRPARCPRCSRIHTSQDVRLSGTRFGAGSRPPAYRAMFDGAPSRPTRQAAMQDMCDRYAQHDETKEQS